MDGNPSKKEEATSSPFIELLKKYTTRVDDHETLAQETTHTYRQQQKTQTDETVNKFQSKTNPIFDINQQIDTDKTNINYKTKWEESEAKYRQLEKKYHQLENKIDQLQRDYDQVKLIKERTAEICSCRQLTNIQLEQLKLLVNNNNNTSIEPIANKNDFHQQTIKLRSILVQHNDELLKKIDEIIKKKRKRNQYEDDLTDEDDDDERNH